MSVVSRRDNCRREPLFFHFCINHMPEIWFENQVMVAYEAMLTHIDKATVVVESAKVRARQREKCVKTRQ